MLGNKDGILGWWEDFFTEWVSIIDKNIAYALLSWQMFQEQFTINGADLSFMGHEAPKPIMQWIDEANPVTWAWNSLKDAFGDERLTAFPVQKQPKKKSDAIQKDMNGDGVRKIDMTFNFNDLPQDVKNSATNGDWTNFGVGFAKTLNVGGLGQNNH